VTQAEAEHEATTVTLQDFVGGAQARLFGALAAAQGAFPPITKDKRVTVRTRDGREYSFSYAPLELILEKTRPALRENGIALTQTFRGGALVTSLLHAGGGMIESVLPLERSGGSWQEFGSAVTYARRYAVVAILGIATEEDDDANHASGNTVEQQPEAKPAAAKPGAASKQQIAKMAVLVKELEAAASPVPSDYAGAEGWVEVMRMRMRAEYGVESRSDLTTRQASELIDWLDAQAIPF
jgi:hypothetical protein